MCLGLSRKSGAGLPKLKKAFDSRMHKPVVVGWNSFQETHTPEAATTNASNLYLNQIQGFQINIINVSHGLLLLF